VAATTVATPVSSRPRGPRRYPVWSARFLLAAFVFGLMVTLVLLLIFERHRRFIKDMEITVVVVAGLLFAVLSIGLYSGARVKKREQMAGELQTFGSLKGLNGSDASGCLDFGNFSLGLGDGCGEAMAGLVLGVLLLILLVIGLWLFINVALIVFFLVSLALGWVFHRALRQVFARSKQCRGDLVNSLYYAAIYTVLYTGWLLAILMLVDKLTKREA
jgi:hypothetical protein